ncbi:FAD-binding oxidoreductase [uncultured Jannaschia sp.]|uniref:NAD(P)/FAD-dependent oxidoreductase n=1 Tax=uncultured Jannaschia sp. TaxID=293347 RepID=UPI002602A40B|nr:FAD-dependent oxidoreductase [uncultured Jannaschia sp.]
MYEFLIIGGGIAGLAAGQALAPLGRVLVLEAEAAIGHHASGRSAALFEESYGKPAVIALNRASRPDHATAGHLSARGFLLVAVEGEDAAFEADLQAMSIAEMSVADARTRVPILSDGVTRAAFEPDAMDLDTDAMLQAGARAVRAGGGAVLTGMRVDAIARAPGGWQVWAGGETHEARTLVNAAGPWADAVARMAGATPLGLTPLRRSMARLKAPGGHDVRGWPMLMGAGESWYAKPDAGAWIVSPAEEDPSEPLDAFADDMVLAEGLARYQEAVTEEVTRPIATWAGLRTFTPDRLLAIGPSELDGFWWSVGQGGYGFQTAPAAARLLADRIAGRGSELGAETVAALDPRRFLRMTA